MADPSVAAIVLAAGRGTRFGAPADDSKVFASLGGRPLVAHAVAAAAASRARGIVVVVGQAAERAPAVLEGWEVAIVRNEGFASGLAGSLKTGLAALPGSVEGVLILLADMPHVAPATLDTLIAAFGRERPDAVVPRFAGRRGNPVLIGRSLFAQVARLDGDEGARRILAEPRCRVVVCDVDDPGVLLDVDTPEALATLARTPV